MSGSSGFFNGSVLPSNWNWGGGGNMGGMGGSPLLPNGLSMPVGPTGGNSLSDASTSSLTGGNAGGIGSNQGWGTEIGPNLGTGQLAMGGLQTLGNLWNAYQSSALANKTFNFSRNLANTNLANQTQAYNTNLAGMADARYAQENKTPAQALDFVNANKLASKTL